MLDQDPLSRDPIRYDGKTVGEVRTSHHGKTFLWFQSPLRGYKGRDWFSMSEGLLAKIPTDCTKFVAKTNEGKCYVFQRRDFETGTKIPIYDSFFNQTPPEPQYAAPMTKALKTFKATNYDSRDVNFRK